MFSPRVGVVDGVSDRRDIWARSSRWWPVVQRGLEVEAALRCTFRRLSLDRCGPQVAAHDCEQLGLHGRGDGHELLPGDADEFAVVVGEAGHVDALEVEALGDAVLDDVADPFVDARADPLEPARLRGSASPSRPSFSMRTAATEPCPAAGPPLPTTPPRSRVSWTSRP